MIPIRGAIRSKNFPAVNILIISLNVIVFLWELLQGPDLKEVFYVCGIVPVRYSNPEVAAHFTNLQQYLPFLTSMFLHGGFLHLIMNMWFLYIFGDNIEDRLGHIRYLAFYFFCGVTAGLVHLFTNWNSNVPTIGASGAISGVMGAYLLLYPRSRILTLIPIFFFFQFVEIPTFIFLGFWFLLQLISAGLTTRSVGGIAFWAHIGGFLSGLVFIEIFVVIPRTGLSGILRQHTGRQTTPRIQTISPRYHPEELDLTGALALTQREASYGARKFITIPQGLKKRSLLVTIPPGVHEGNRLRLKGLGQRDAMGNQGDLFLEVRIFD
ncbi:MAG TPA: rhomboid family intramembrane serine protease [Thermodesulfobacteriota bacterium]|nr:rhomboid family intramembrane serine protease [Thermodesulfobacteriota bacterium]